MFDECADNLFEESFVFANCQSLYIFENKVLGTQFSDQSGKVMNKRVSGIVERPLADQTKTLTGCTAKKHIEIALSYLSRAGSREGASTPK